MDYAYIYIYIDESIYIKVNTNIFFKYAFIENSKSIAISFGLPT